MVNNNECQILMGPKTKKVNIQVQIIFIKEGNQIVAYAPALDLSTCGKTIEKANKRFREVLNIFLEEVIHMGTLDQVLENFARC